jgi:hypothetical protein
LANRSDFFSAKLPRGLKKLMAMGEIYGYIKNSHERGRFKRMMIEAHSNHVNYKMRRNALDVKDSDE